MNDVADALTAAYADIGEDLPRLRDRLTARAADEGLVDVAYRTIDTPLGELLLAATTGGLVRVAYPNEGHESVLQSLADRISPRIVKAPKRLDPVARELDDYFAQRRRSFDVPLDWRLSSGFRRTVLTHLPEIGYGRTASYAAIAKAAGNPKAVRAVGTACATNPLPVIVPCHRVIRSDGTFGGYVGGPAAKEMLLTLEKAA